MSSEYVSIERGLGPEGRIALVRFDRGNAVNPLSPEAMRQLRSAARSFEDDIDTSVVVLTGNSRAFSAGFDLKDTERREKSGLGLGEHRKSLRIGPSMCKAWADMEQVTICAIEGLAIGGGAALAVSTDFRVLARGAHFRIPEIALGLNMSWGSIPRMMQLMGPARTKQAVILANERIAADDAHAWGLAEFLADDGKALDCAMDLAHRMAAMPPMPVKMTKATVNRLAGALDDLASHMDLDQFTLTGLSEDSKEGIQSFLERRTPKFRGR
ncbi:MAG: enoyl-CoA hydratase/isomerase family protein [Hyphomicrobiaceae bacterium]